MQTHPFPFLQPFHSRLDVRFFVREDAVSGDREIEKLTESEKIASVKQMHGNRAIRVRTDSRRMEEADALATDIAGLTLTIRFADCQNFIVYEPKKHVACLIHAGWRGLKSGVIGNAFALLKKEWSIDPKDTVVVAGPSLCEKCAEFTDPNNEAPELSNYARGRFIDLRSAADDQLFALGVSRDRFERSSDCTRCSSHRYFSYRGGDREAVKNGFINCFAVTLL